MILRAVTAAVAVFLALLLAGSAWAHQGNPDYRSVIDRLVPDDHGLVVEVIDYDADIRLTPPRGIPVEIPGYDDEPYARIGADGTVQVNSRSPSAYMNTDRYADVPVPESANPEAEPDWETVRTDGIFQWHDHRSHWMSPEPPPGVSDSDERTEVFDYSIPIVVDGDPVKIEGTLYWVGTEQGNAAPILIAGAAVLIAAALAALVARRRRARGEGSPPEAW